MAKIRGFWNDADGLGARDYLLLISTGVFFLAVAAGLVMSPLGIDLGTEYLRLIDMVSPVVMTIVGGVFGVQAVESFNGKRSNQVTVSHTQEIEFPVEDDNNTNNPY